MSQLWTAWLALPVTLRWILVLVIGALLFSGGSRHRRRQGGGWLLLLIAGAVFLFAETGGAVTAAVSHNSNVALGQQLASGYGWGSGPEWTCLDELWTRESGWRMVWNTQGSGAYGIPQALPASKMASAGADYMTNPTTQIKWGLGYIKSAYGDPCTAWVHETADNWY